MAFNLYSMLVEPVRSDDDGSFEDRPGPSSSRKKSAASLQYVIYSVLLRTRRTRLVLNTVAQ